MSNDIHESRFVRETVERFVVPVFPWELWESSVTVSSNEAQHILI